MLWNSETYNFLQLACNAQTKAIQIISIFLLKKKKLKELT